MHLAERTLALETFWRSLLDVASSNGHKPLAFFDLDEFVFEHDTIALGAEESARRSGVDSSFAKVYEQFKLGQTDMTMGELLTLGVTDALARFDTLEDYIEWVVPRQTVRSDFKRFMALLNSHGIASIAVTNGIKPVAEALLAHHDLIMPVAANDIARPISKVQIDCLSDRAVGVDKGKLVRMAMDWGYTVCGGGGDSRNDIGLAQAVSEAKGFVIARRNLGLATWCRANLVGRFQEFDDFQEIEPYVLQTLKANNLLR